MPLYGSDPEIMAEGARWAVEHSATIVDINMGRRRTRATGMAYQASGRYTLPSMLHRSSTFRLFVTLLLAVAVPLCCCNFRMWLTACEPCDAANSLASSEPIAHEHAGGNCHDHNSDRHAVTASKEGIEPSSSPCVPGHEDDHDCACGKHNTLLTVAKSNLDLPTPLLVAILSFPAFADTLALPRFQAIDRGLWVSARPPTTLLRLHCALIV